MRTCGANVRCRSSVAEAMMQKQCGSVAGAVQKQCRSGAEAVRKQCGSGAEVVRNGAEAVQLVKMGQKFEHLSRECGEVGDGFFHC